MSQNINDSNANLTAGYIYLATYDELEKYMWFRCHILFCKRNC